MRSTIKYEYPELINPEATKPAALANLSFPYNDLPSDRRFEELIYSVIKTKLSYGTFAGFDNISLLTGVREKGRDCVLLKENRNVGLIQCKKYKNNLSKKDFGLEITKFILYSIIEPGLVADIDCFTYYIAVSTNFVLECSNFIDSFNETILQEEELKNWVDKNLLQPSLAKLKIENITEIVRNKLSRIKVRKILPQDLDSYLSESDCRHLQALFFEVRVLEGNSSFEKLKELVNSRIGDDISQEQIDIELVNCSCSLRFERNEFEDIPESHVIRKETSDLLNWIIQPAEKNEKGNDLNVCLLAGNAGMGKTVILKDLYDELTKNNIPVLAIKADKLYAISIKELQEKIGLSMPIFKFVDKCKQNYEKLVIIIDQIDALSQSMSSDRSSLMVYSSLINTYTHDPSIRIVISVRVFDLYYDPSLRVYKNIKSIEVGLLDVAVVLAQLSKIGLTRSQVSSKLLSLLQVPNNLSVFGKIAKGLNVQNGITSIQDLYVELWRQKVLNVSSLKLSNTKVIDLLYALANHMYNLQRVSISEHKFEAYHSELLYLESERIIKREGSQIQFFHQSFYDFVFSKQFVERNGDVLSYVMDQEQSISMRSALKMIINYLRDYEQERYIVSIRTLLSNCDVSFHLKHLVISILSSTEYPNEEEIDILIHFVTNSIHLRNQFLETAQSEAWFQVACRNGFLSVIQIDPSINNAKQDDSGQNGEQVKINTRIHRLIASNFLSRYLNRNVQLAWDFARTIKDDSIVHRMLYELDNWGNPIAEELLENCRTFAEVDRFSYNSVIRNVSKVNPLYAWNMAKSYLTSELSDNESSHRHSQEQTLLMNLVKHVADYMIGAISDIVDRNLMNEHMTGEGMMEDYRYSRVEITNKGKYRLDDFTYQLLGLCLRDGAERKSDTFRLYLTERKFTGYTAILRLVIFAIRKRMEVYSNEVYEIFIHLSNINYLKIGNNAAVEFRELFGKSFRYFSDEQKKTVVLRLKDIINRDEIFSLEYQDKSVYISYWGKGKYYYLLRLPGYVIALDKELKRVFGELTRRFGEISDKVDLDSVTAGVVRPPIPNNVYSKMSIGNWIQSFRSYNSNRNPFEKDYLKGGVHEHCWSLKKYIEKDPCEKMIKLVRLIVPEFDIPISYSVMGLWGLAIGQVEKPILQELFKGILKRGDWQAEIRNLLSISEYLIGDLDDDTEIVNFIITQSENYTNRREKVGEIEGETNIDGLVTLAINTIYGAAARLLPMIKNPELEHRIFGAIENIIKSGPDESRAALYSRFANLNNLNEKRAYSLFRDSLIGENNIYVIASSIWSLQYMGNYDFVNLKPVYERLVTAKKLGDNDTSMLFSILYFSYLFDKSGAEELLFKLLEENEKSGSWAFSVVGENYFLNDGASKSHKVLINVIKHASKDAHHKFRFSQLAINNIGINEIYFVVEAYVNSSIFALNHNLLSYLTQQCKTSPFKCIDLFEMAYLKAKSLSDEDDTINHADITKFIVGAYSSVKGADEISRVYRKRLLSSFDSLLMDYRFRENTDKVLDELM